MNIVYHFPGVSKDAVKEILQDYYKNNKVSVYKDEFNEHVTLLFEASEGYHESDILVNYIIDNNFNYINICNNGIHNKNSDKILQLKKLFDERYESLKEYLLFIDSGDVLLNINIPFDEILKIFNSYNCEILFNKDEGDYPCDYYFDFMQKNRFWSNDYNDRNIENLYDIDKKYFLNSGVYFGKKEHIKELIDISYDILIKNPEYDSDQFIFKKVTRILNDKYNKHFIEIDYNKKLFSIVKY